MISKKRLEELIEQGATIYDSWHGNEFFARDIEKFYYDVVTYSFLLNEYKTTLEDLHEDYEDFKWYKEFGCIERVERLELPNFEKFLKYKKSINFYKNNYEYWLQKENYNYDNEIHDMKIEIYVYDSNLESSYCLFCKPLTKENYLLACRKCKELFLGEKV